MEMDVVYTEICVLIWLMIALEVIDITMDTMDMLDRWYWYCQAKRMMD